MFSTENGAGRRKGEAEELTEVRGATTRSSNFRVALVHSLGSLAALLVCPQISDLEVGSLYL